MNFLEIGKQPISETQPAGNDVRFDPEVEALSREIEKLSSPTASGTVDWKRVVEFSRKVLTEQSKDLLVACYFSMGLCHQEQAAGLAQGIHVIRDLLENFWETLYPPKKRMRGRKNALDWWLEKTEAAVQSIEARSESQEAIAAISGDLDAIDRFLDQNMEDAPSLRRLLDRVAALQMQTAGPAESAGQPAADEPAAPAPVPKPVPASRPEPVPPAPAAIEPGAKIQSEDDVQRMLRGALAKLKEVAAHYMDRDLFHPLIYRLNRIAAWTPVEGLPPNADGKTRIPPPPPHVLHAIETQYRGGDWQNLITTAESRVGEFLFWLDLSRFTAEALDRLRKENLRDLVSQETSRFVAKLKGLETLCFSDGKPFADADTQAWLREIATPGPTAASGISYSAGGSLTGIQATVAEAYEKAEGLVKEKKPAEAVSLLHSRLRDSASGKEKLLWRMALSQLLVGAKVERTAAPHLRAVLDDIDRYRLEQWDPDLALDALLVVYSGFRAQKEDEAENRALSILDRIAGIDPARALSLK